MDERDIRFVYFLTVVHRDLMDETLIRAHVAHLEALERDGVLELCGPFADGRGGMVMLRGVDEAAARRIAEGDPFVASGAESYELRRLTLSHRGNAHLGMSAACTGTAGGPEGDS